MDTMSQRRTLLEPVATKFCVDCKWIIPDDSGIEPNLPHCGHADAIQQNLDLVTGASSEYRNICSAQRIHRCGPEGKNWEAHLKVYAGLGGTCEVCGGDPEANE